MINYFYFNIFSKNFKPNKYKENLLIINVKNGIIYIKYIAIIIIFSIKKIKWSDLYV